MKTKVLTNLLVIAAFMGMTCCDKVDDTLGGDSKVEADINGSHWESSASMTYYAEAAEPVGTTMIGQSLTDFKEFIIHWKGMLSEGTVTLTDGSSDYYITWAEPTKNYNSVSGTLTISKIASNGKVTGTFSFTGKEEDGTGTIEVTNGKFADVVKRL